ncbi:uncharacterized protein LOC124154961 [Ischnura elegans]|uniref:uncharacterized protein LOC124154961 n=1 Tax=Ischnura elegans TaxID=197161 RepID=UPI001ED87B36|nr:uncharacterized protein LOC124154961 [Ischnura elegans]
MDKMNKSTASVLLLLILSLVGASGAAVYSKPCRNGCPEIYKPVCGVSSCGKTRVFSNSCEVEIYNCNTPDDKYTATTSNVCPDFPNMRVD